MNNKPGVKTSEFWVAILTPILTPIILSLTNKYGLAIPESAVVNLLTLSIAAIPIYGVGRVYNKRNVEKPND